MARLVVLKEFVTLTDKKGRPRAFNPDFVVSVTPWESADPISVVQYGVPTQMKEAFVDGTVQEVTALLNDDLSMILEPPRKA
jgi:hypothetical protein